MNTHRLPTALYLDGKLTDNYTWCEIFHHLNQITKPFDVKLTIAIPGEQEEVLITIANIENVLRKFPMLFCTITTFTVKREQRSEVVIQFKWKAKRSKSFFILLDYLLSTIDDIFPNASTDSSDEMGYELSFQQKEILISEPKYEINQYLEDIFELGVMVADLSEFNSFKAPFEMFSCILAILLKKQFPKGKVFKWFNAKNNIYVFAFEHEQIVYTCQFEDYQLNGSASIYQTKAITVEQFSTAYRKQSSELSIGDLYLNYRDLRTNHFPNAFTV